MTRIVLLLVVGTSSAFGAGCQRGTSNIAPPEAPVVPVSRPVSREVTDYVYYTGRTNAKEMVSIQPRVTGYLIKMPFKEGADVKTGDLLFEIDPRPYQAQLEAAQAAVEQKVASLKYAEATHANFKDVAKQLKSAVSARELDQYEAQEKQARANLKLAEANLDVAQLNLEWTKVKSPIDGRISRYYLTEGNLVNQDVTQLTTLVSLDPMYAYFELDEPTYQRVNRAITQGSISTSKSHVPPRPEWTMSVAGLLAALDGPAPLLATSSWISGSAAPDVPVWLGLQGEDGYPHRGTVNFIDNQVNPGTGSIAVRGQFANPPTAQGNRLLVPGMFVRIRLAIGQPREALLIIDRAVTSDQAIKYVYVVDQENKVQQRRVTTGALQEDGLRVIREGLQPNDWVVIGSLQQVKMRMTVQPDQLTMPSLIDPAKAATQATGKTATGKTAAPAKGKR